jgi:hypothetical protein
VDWGYAKIGEPSFHALGRRRRGKVPKVSLGDQGEVVAVAVAVAVAEAVGVAVAGGLSCSEGLSGGLAVVVWRLRLWRRRRDGLLYSLLNCYVMRRTRSGLLPLLATTNEPCDEESKERPHSSSHYIPPAPSQVSSSSPHGAIPSSTTCSKESRVATAFVQQGT